VPIPSATVMVTSPPATLVPGVSGLVSMYRKIDGSGSSRRLSDLPPLV
jgi:hypothetical protein